MGKKEGVDKFVLVSSASVGMKISPPELALDERKLRADEAKGRWRPTRLEPAMLNEVCASNYYEAFMLHTSLCDISAVSYR